MAAAKINCDTMPEITDDLRDSIQATDACLDDVRGLAEQITGLPAQQIEQLLVELVTDAQDHAVSRLLQATAYNQLKLDPDVLCSCIGVCVRMDDSAPCFALQGERAIEPLLAAALAEELTVDRQLYAARIAAEITGKLGLDPQPVRKILWKLEQTGHAPSRQIVTSQSLLLLKPDTPEHQLFLPKWIDSKLSDLLPEHKPHASIGGYYTVRRPIPKLGRNDPCHCGSGKKYKKCCFAKDQELLRDASEYAGTTRTELKARPGLVDDPSVIRRMQPYELKKVDPSQLSKNQLFTGYRCAADYGLRELAFEMLREYQRRTDDDDELDYGHFEDLVEDVLAAGDLDLARRIDDHCRGHTWYRPQAIQFSFDLLEHPDRFEPLECDCRKSVCGILDEETAYDEPLIRLSHTLRTRHPALAVVFARAAIASNPERYLDNETLLEVIRELRIDLDLEPWHDPAEALFDWIEDRSLLKRKAEAESEDVKRLSSKLETARSALDEKKHILREMEQQIRVIGTELEKTRALSEKDSIQATTPRSQPPDQEETLTRLRERVEDLKAEVGEQQEQRRQLRKLLTKERKKPTVPSIPDEQSSKTGGDSHTLGLKPSGKPLVPEYKDAFRSSCDALAPAVAAKAILAAGRFAAHDPEVWRQTKPLERLPRHYRVRIGRDYRLILYWQPGKTLDILDVIPRQDLESWIKRHGQ